MSKNCITCGSSTVYSVSAKSRNKNYVWNIDGVPVSTNDYLPEELHEIGDKDGVKLSWCRSCGQIQDAFRKKLVVSNTGIIPQAYKRIASIEEIDVNHVNYIVDSDLLVDIIEKYEIENLSIKLLNLGFHIIPASNIVDKIKETIMIPKVTEELSLCLEDAFSEQDFIENLESSNIKEEDLLEEMRVRPVHSHIMITLYVNQSMISINNPSQEIIV